MKIINKTNPEEIIKELEENIKDYDKVIKNYNKSKNLYKLIAILLTILEIVSLYISYICNQEATYAVFITLFTIINPFFIVTSLIHSSFYKSYVEEKKYYKNKKMNILNADISVKEKAKQAANFINKYYIFNDFDEKLDILKNKKIKKAELNDKQIFIDYVNENKEVKKSIIHVDLHYFEDLKEPEIIIYNTSISLNLNQSFKDNKNVNLKEFLN